MPGNILGTATGLTPTTLLISTLQQIPDAKTQTALRQVQDWANSFYVHNFGEFSGPYVTGGVTVTWPRVFPNAVQSVTATAFGSPGLAVTVNTLGNRTTIFQLWGLTTGAEVPNATSVLFFYDAWGH